MGLFKSPGVVQAERKSRMIEKMCEIYKSYGMRSSKSPSLSIGTWL